MRSRSPQDVGPGDDDRGVPNLARFSKGAAVYAREYARALRRGNYRARADACWGLTACGSASLDWARGCLDSGDPVQIADAGGVLRFIGVPPEWLPWIRSIALALPDGEAADVLFELIDAAEGPLPEEDKTNPSEYLLGGAWLPFTEPIWFLRASLEQTAVELEKWMRQLGRRNLYTLHEPLTRMLDRLEPFSIPGWKDLVVGTSGDWTAVFSQGGDTHIADVIGRRLGVPSLRTHYSPQIVRDGKRIGYGDRAFWYEDGVGNHRTIQASFQSRWEWHLYGAALDFEDHEAYNAKQIPDRFTLERLNEYCRALGINRNDPDFYRTDGILVQEDISNWAHQPTNKMTSARWRVTHL